MNPAASYNESSNKITITFRGETRDFTPRMDMGSSFWVPRVFSGKFRSGAKIWPCDIFFVKATGRLTIQPGGYSNKGGVASIVGWFNENDTQNSKN